MPASLCSVRAVPSAGTARPSSTCREAWLTLQQPLAFLTTLGPPRPLTQPSDPRLLSWLVPGCLWAYANGSLPRADSGSFHPCCVYLSEGLPGHQSDRNMILAFQRIDSYATARIIHIGPGSQRAPTLLSLNVLSCKMGVITLAHRGTYMLVPFPLEARSLRHSFPCGDPWPGRCRL